ncbi:MAG: 23S rRNA (guanosine(2251)-2'-O)-methyltransferase RlmB [Gammaproteobacteria bacterium]|nr:23S rRNA (guanosine(2251)-2'-O)-methyltransferase RlmB [Gammaproteobacteria bacterium]
MSDPQTVAGMHSVRTALKHGVEGVAEVWVEARRRDKKIREIVALAKAAGVILHQVDRAELDAMVPGVNHQGAVARVAVPAARGEQDLEQLLGDSDTQPLLLILDGVQDPHNLGACLRSADAAGVLAVIAPKDRSVGLTPTACKVASGAAETVPFIQVTNLARTIRWLQDEHRVWVVGTAGEAETSLYQADLKGPLALVMGAEEKGMRRLTREACDLLVKLPMAGSVESLNVSVATGVCLFEANRQRSLTE